MIDDIRSAAIRAIELDPNLAEAHATMATYHNESWEWAEAEREFQRALELNPDSVATCSCYSLVLAVQGRFPEAIALGERAAKVNPFSTLVRYNHGVVLRNARRFDEAATKLSPRRPSPYETKGPVRR